MKKLLTNTSITQGILVTVMIIVFLSLLLVSSVYFLTYSRATSQLVQEQYGEINKNIILNYKKVVDSLIESVSYVQLSLKQFDVLRDSRELEAQIRLNSSVKKILVGISLFDTDGNLVAGDPVSPDLHIKIPDRRWFIKARREGETLQFSEPHYQSLYLQRKQPVVSVSQAVTYSSDHTLLTGVLVAEFFFNDISGLSSLAELGDGGHILILDDQGTLLYSSDMTANANPAESLETARNTVLGGVKTRINHRTMYIYINTLDRTRWRIATIHNMDRLSKSFQKAILYLVLVFLGVSLIAFGLAILLAAHITQPLDRLRAHMEKVEDGDFKGEVELQGQKEILVLARAFNHMIHTIQDLMDKIVEEQRNKERSDLKVLQYQINPHFLYNTLDSIAWLAEKGRNADVVSSVLALSKFFRIGISDGKDFIPLSKELDHIINYLTIQSIRFENRFRYEILVDEKLKGFMVMKLMLQPLVENALRHGITEESDNVITISGHCEGRFLILTVSNTGYGISGRKIQEIYDKIHSQIPSESLGLKNVFQRLKLYYGDQADLKIQSEDDVTRISILIPLQEGGGDV